MLSFHSFHVSPFWEKVSSSSCSTRIQRWRCLPNCVCLTFENFFRSVRNPFHGYSFLMIEAYSRLNFFFSFWKLLMKQTWTPTQTKKWLWESGRPFKPLKRMVSKRQAIDIIDLCRGFFPPLHILRRNLDSCTVSATFFPFTKGAFN